MKTLSTFFAFLAMVAFVASSNAAQGNGANESGAGQAAHPSDTNAKQPIDTTLPAGRGEQNPIPGNGAQSNSMPGATIDAPRGQVDIGTNANGGLNVEVNRNGPANPANGQMRQELRDNRQTFRQDLRSERQENRSERQTNQNDPNRWRFVLQNGEWWYWLPSNSWVIWRENRWMPYDADNFQPNGYRVGFRGLGNGSTMFYVDENGLRYRRDYSPGRPQSMEMQQMQERPNSMPESNLMGPGN